MDSKATPTIDVDELNEVFRRTIAKTGVAFDAIVDFDWHRYDGMAFTDLNNSLHTYEHKIAQPGRNTVDDSVMFYVMSAFNCTRNPESFKEYAGKAKALLDAVIESYDEVTMKKQ